MIERQETVDDIIAEKRRRADEIERDCAEKMKRGEMVSDCYFRELVADIRREADRLDAANKREYAMQKSVIDNLTKALKGTVEGLAWIYDRKGYAYGTDAAYAAGCAVLDLLGVEYEKEGVAK